MTDVVHGQPGIREWAGRFAVLGDPNRLRLLLLIHRCGPISVTELSDLTALKQTTVSHALRLLRINGMVDTTRVGKSRHYWLRDTVTASLLDHLLDMTSGVEGTKALHPET